MIDNGSNDGSRDYIKKIGESNHQIKIIFNESNIGFAAGHNLGIKMSDSEYVVCLNQDVILDKSFLKNAIEILDKNDKMGALQPKILRLKKNDNSWQKTDIIDTTGLLMLKNRRIINRAQGLKESDHGLQVAGDIFGVDGAAPIYKREMLENIKVPLNGGKFEYFDEDFFMYKEDVDLAWRMKLFGWQAFYAPNVICWHARGSGDSAKLNYFDIIKERRKISQFSKYHSFKNQRLMQVKNEIWQTVLFDFPQIVFKETASWFYVLFFERYAVGSIVKLLKHIPKMLKKRKFIMRNKRIGVKEIRKWFS